MRILSPNNGDVSASSSRLKLPRAPWRLAWVASRLLDLKAFGERIASQDKGRQTAEVQIRVARMTRCNKLGTAEIERVA